MLPYKVKSTGFQKLSKKFHFWEWSNVSSKTCLLKEQPCICRFEIFRVNIMSFVLPRKSENKSTLKVTQMSFSVR